jgi:hypothetical protein
VVSSHVLVFNQVQEIIKNPLRCFKSALSAFEKQDQ